MENNIEPSPYAIGIFNSLVYPNKEVPRLILDVEGEGYVDHRISHDIAAHILGLEAIMEGVTITLSNYQKDRYCSVGFKGLEDQHHELYVKNKIRDTSQTNQDQDVINMMIENPNSHMPEIQAAVNGIVAESHGRWMNVFENTRLPSMVEHYVKQEIKKLNDSSCCRGEQEDETYTDRILDANGEEYQVTFKLNEVEQPGPFDLIHSETRKLIIDQLFEESCEGSDCRLIFDDVSGEAVFPGTGSVIDVLSAASNRMVDGDRLKIAVEYAIRVLSA